MTSVHHEVPTHLNVEDKVLFGLTVRQFLYVLVGSSASYALWQQTLQLSDGPRTLLVGMCVVLTLAFALVRPAGRALEEWLVAAWLFAASPRRATWQSPEPVSADWRPAGGTWQELSPSLAWAEDDDG